jgi:hypothetical protein
MALCSGEAREEEVRNERQSWIWLSFLALLFSLLLPRFSFAALFQAGEAGIGIQWQPNATGTANPISLGPFIVTMQFEPNNAPQSKQTRPCVVSQDGLTALYTITAADFPAQGQYYVQFIAVQGSTVRKSPVITISVGPSL